MTVQVDHFTAKFISLSFAVLYGRVVSIEQSVKDFDAFTSFSSATRLPEVSHAEEISIRLSMGQVIGRSILLNGLTWTVDMNGRDYAHDSLINQQKHVTRNNVTAKVYAFLGVPYAEPPIGHLRFKPPQKFNRFWDDAFVAHHFKPACAQDIASRPNVWRETTPYEYTVDEDCLYLNVFTPEASLSASRMFPVIVFFHGGNFQSGSSNDWPGHMLASKGIVVVTVNYRLGPFGFLSLPGRQSNFGLLDQRLAMQWVRENIYAFGGDPNRVCAVGHEAGAASAGLHMLSPGSSGLMSSVAALSGSHLSYDQVITHPMLAYNNTGKLGRAVGCFDFNVGEVFECLKTRSTQDILAGSRDMLVEYNRFAFLPTVDKHFLVDSPLNLLTRKQVASQLPYLTGLNLHDGAEVLLSDRFLARSGFAINQKYVDHYVFDLVLKRNYTTNREAVMNAVKHAYTFWPDARNDDKIRQQFVKMTTDLYYTSPISLAAQLHSEAGSVVFMYFNAYNFSTGALNSNQRFLADWNSICHDCELYLLFGFPWLPRHLLPIHFRNIQWTERDKDASEIFMTMFKKYAESKNPDLQYEATWLNYGPRDHFYLLFNITMSLLKDYEWTSVAFWNIYIHQLADHFTTTFSPTVAGIRRQLNGYKLSTGVLVFLLALCLTVCGTLSYYLFEKNKRHKWLQATNKSGELATPSSHFDSSHASYGMR